MTVTIKHVAEHANVSTTTVSHVLNRTRFVSKKSTAAVMAAVESLNYAPSAIARSLKMQHTKSIGMLITTTLNPYYAEVVKAVEKRCYQLGYTLVLCNTDGQRDKTESYLKMLQEKRTDGIILMCAEYSQSAFQSLPTTLPVVVMDWGPTNSTLDKIQDNSLLGGALATQFLIDNNHHNIGFIGGPSQMATAQNRLQGFEKTMQQASIEINRDWVIHSNFEADGGRQAMKQLIAQDNKPSAIFVANDLMALGVISEAQQQGISIPGELSIIGYDNINFSEFFNPPLTTINQPKTDLANRAVDTLIDRLNNPRINGKTILVEPHLVVRASVKKLN